MSDFVTVEVKGLKELQEKLEELPLKLAKKDLRSALRAGATLIKKAMIALAPRDTGFLSQHFSIKTKIKTGEEIAGSAFIGPQGKINYPKTSEGKKGIGRRIAVATVARFLEFGTIKMSKKPFMTQAIDSNKSDAIDAIAKRLSEVMKDVK
jgi:HK97 gp10 family phage protein